MQKKSPRKKKISGEISERIVGKINEVMSGKIPREIPKRILGENLSLQKPQKKSSRKTRERIPETIPEKNADYSNCTLQKHHSEIITLEFSRQALCRLRAMSKRSAP